MLLDKRVDMDIFDLHSDTLYKAMMNGTHIDRDDYEFKYSDFKNGNRWYQCFACWTPDSVNEIPKKFWDTPLIDYFIASSEKLIEECKLLGVELNNIKADKSFILTVENSSILENNIENIDYLTKYNVKIATLTWNGHNCIGDGAGVKNPKGATEFGKRVIDEYIKRGIAIDVSHASDALFYDIASKNPKKILATHSNSRSVCNHIRNLSDEEFIYIRDKGGIVGINLHRFFLEEKGYAGIKDILNHAYHFLSLGGENSLALGTDFDGADMTGEIATSNDLGKLYYSFIENNFEKSVVDKIFFKNAYEFYDKL